MPAIGDFIYGGYFAGWMDTTKGNIIVGDASQTGKRYMLIVSPKSLEQALKQYKTTDTAAPVSSQTRWDGLTATVAMTGATYPAANYCNGLTYPADGGSQWYLPAMDELELIYRNLKTTTEVNLVAARRATGFPGGTAGMGQNVSSDPVGVAYTTGSPAQTSVALFKSGGAQALDVATADTYWSSTEQAALYAWVQTTHDATGYAGNQDINNKSLNSRVRPVRRVLAAPAVTAFTGWGIPA